MTREQGEFETVNLHQTNDKNRTLVMEAVKTDERDNNNNNKKKKRRVISVITGHG